MITRKQYQLLAYMKECLEQDDVPPSYEEMKSALDLKSKSGIHRLITGLEERGYIRRLPNRARAIEIIRVPNSLEQESGMMPPANEEPAQASASNQAQSQFNFGNTPEIPFYGRLGNTLQVEAMRAPKRMIQVPAELRDGEGEHLAFEMVGEYMNGAGIHSGDIVIMKKTVDAENGDLILATVDKTLLTFKRYYLRGHNVVLEPANRVYVSSTYRPSRVEVQAKLVGLYRRYG